MTFSNNILWSLLDHDKITLIIFYHSFLYQQTAFYMHLSGKFEKNSWPGTDADAWFFTFLDIIDDKYCCNKDLKNCLIRLPHRLMPSFFILKWFHPSHNTLFHRRNHTNWYLSMVIIWHWYVSMHRCFCLQPFKVWLSSLSTYFIISSSYIE